MWSLVSDVIIVLYNLIDCSYSSRYTFVDRNLDNPLVGC